MVLGSAVLKFWPAPGSAALQSRTEVLAAPAAVSLLWAHVNTDWRHPACKLVIAVTVLCTCVQKQNLQRKTSAIYKNRSVKVVEEAISRAPPSVDENEISSFILFSCEDEIQKTVN